MIKYNFKISFILIYFFLTLNLFAEAEDITKDNEFKLKSVYLTRLADFTNWPSFDEDDGINICIDASSPLVIFLNEIDDLEKNGKRLNTIYNISSDSLENCQIFYLSDDRPDLLKERLKLLNKKSILTISSIDEFAKKGGMVEFYISKNKVRMKVNLASLRKSKIFISSKVLKLMSIVKR